ncbi:MAG TPA: hypothetical protein VIN38_08425 [Thiobacillus sp.]
MYNSHDIFDHRWFNTHRYALIDAEWRDELPTSWPLTLIAPAFLGEDTARCPVLLDIHALSRDDLGKLLQQLSTQVTSRQDALCSLLLASQHEPKSVANHLAQRMVLTLPGESVRKQLRYFDPGTFLQLPRLLGANGLAWLLDKVESVILPWAGQWTHITQPEPVGSTFRLEADHLAALSRLGVVNRVAMQMAQPVDAQEWEQTCAKIDDHVQRAMAKYGLTQQADLVAFASHALDHHPMFDSHPRLAALFQTLRTATPEDELDYRELTSRFSPEDWQQICIEQQKQGLKSPQQGLRS